MPLFCFKLVQIILKSMLQCTCPADRNRILISLLHEWRERTPGDGQVHDCELGFFWVIAIKKSKGGYGHEEAML